jgi:hypothetical protein
MKRVFFCFVLVIFAVYTRSQVHLQTGAAVFDFPVYSYKDDKTGLSTNIVLNYNSGNGIRVGEAASFVGLGWALNAGGSITRIQCGAPDDQYDNTYSPNDLDQIIAKDNLTLFAGYYPNGLMYSQFSLSDVPKELAVQPRFQTNTDSRYRPSPQASADREQDYFMLNLNGRITQFAIGKTGIIEVLDDSKLKIDYTVQDMRSQNIRTKINEFIITDELGIKYRFSEMELSEVAVFEPVYNSGTQFRLSVMGAVFQGKYVVTKWQLKEIINPFTNAAITFHYDNLVVESLADVLPTYDVITGMSAEGVSVTENKTRIHTKQLELISFPDGSEVDFIYTGATRYDFGDEELDKIRVNEFGAPTRQIRLEQKYFYKSSLMNTNSWSLGDQEKEYLRLCLTAIETEGEYARGQGEFKVGKFTFQYYDGTEIANPKSIVPHRYTFAQDHWGYYNLSTLINDDVNGYYYDGYAIKNLLTGYGSGTRAPYPLAARNGLLKSITYPTGGTLTYEYAQNTYDLNGTSINVGGVHVSKTTLHDNVSSSNDQVAEYKYVKTDGISSSAWGYETPEYETEQTVTVRKDNSGFDAGALMLYDKTSQNWIKGIVIFQTTGIDLALHKLLGPLGQVISVVVKFIVAKMTEIVYNWLDQVDDFNTKSYSLAPHFSGNAIGIRFSRVQVKNISLPDPIGRTVYEYTMPASSADILPYSFPYALKQRMDEWKYGLIKKVVLYDKLDNIVKENETDYGFTSATLNSNFQSVKIAPNHSLSSRYDYFQANRDWVNSTWISSEFYTLRKGRLYVNQTREKAYGKSGRYFENFTNYSYNSNPSTDNYLPREVTTTNSKNETVGKTVYYSRDYTANGVLADMITNHIYNVPVVELSWVQAHGGTKKYTAAKVTEFIKLANGEIKPHKVYVAQNDAPVPAASVGAFDPNVPGYSFPNLTLVTTYTYSSTGDLLKVTAEGNQRTCFIYDFNDRLISASVSNASEDEIAYSSFESSKTGNWTFGSSAGYSYENDYGNAPTGFRFLNISSSQIGGQAVLSKSGLVSSKQYIVSYWSNSGLVYVNGQTLSPVYMNPVTGWSFYTYQVTGATSVQITGEGTVDELRLYPADARMQTVAYDPQVGQTARCDINNRIVYYSYDRAGRMIFVQDQEKNVIKTYEYNVINK